MTTISRRNAEPYLSAVERTRALRSWAIPRAVDSDDLLRLPPDLTANGLGRRCRAQQHRHPDGWTCTRLDGHTGRHAAGDSYHILAVWP